MSLEPRLVLHLLGPLERVKAACGDHEQLEAMTGSGYVVIDELGFWEVAEERCLQQGQLDAASLAVLLWQPRVQAHLSRLLTLPEKPETWV